MWANSVWGFFSFALAFALAVLGVPQEYLWLRPYFIGASIICAALGLVILCWPLRHDRNRAKVREVFRHPIKWIPRLVDPRRMIIAGLSIAVVGVVIAAIGVWRQA